ncbi:ATP-binding cassette domain-containing protein [Winogradskyella sp.]|uniref:ATP-binding cassette domain-containing protein n=1 Tax=Winogradskyella sp. TaxID=1883156 RepID=UPI001B0E62BF|nr:ATP-binding cassette domain-containing protein [Winogradskyella sp.]MBO6880173.1 ATP-binding cassette domain-containing protein [Winogradskyella sp.]
MRQLHIDSVTKSYNNKVILSDVYLHCKIGEIKGLIGRNGSGKSTLLKIIFGIERAENKFIRADSKIIKNVADGRNIINYLPQDNFLPNGVLIKTLINIFLNNEEKNTVLGNEYIKPLLNKKNQHLSTGEKRIIEILLIVHSEAKFILLDEPFNGLSPILKNYVVSYIKKMKQKKGFIITDHDYENVVGISDELSFLKNGYLKKLKHKNELVELGYLTTSI